MAISRRGMNCFWGGVASTGRGVVSSEGEVFLFGASSHMVQRVGGDWCKGEGVRGGRATGCGLGVGGRGPFTPQHGRNGWGVS